VSDLIDAVRVVAVFSLYNGKTLIGQRLKAIVKTPYYNSFYAFDPTKPEQNIAKLLSLLDFGQQIYNSLKHQI